jgi:hypothetical protein
VRLQLPVRYSQSRYFFSRPPLKDLSQITFFTGVAEVATVATCFSAAGEVVREKVFAAH